NAQGLGRLQHDVHMARRFRMHKLIGELLRHRRHEIAMLSEKMDVLMIRSRLDGIDLDRIGSPVLKEQPQRAARQSPPSELLHKVAVGNPFLPSRGDFLVELTDKVLRVYTIHEVS